MREISDSWAAKRMQKYMAAPKLGNHRINNQRTCTRNGNANNYGGMIERKQTVPSKAIQKELHPQVVFPTDQWAS